LTIYKRAISTATTELAGSDVQTTLLGAVSLRAQIGLGVLIATKTANKVQFWRTLLGMVVSASDTSGCYPAGASIRIRRCAVDELMDSVRDCLRRVRLDTVLSPGNLRWEEFKWIALGQ
jgi:hypothetical protein